MYVYVCVHTDHATQCACLEKDQKTIANSESSTRPMLLHETAGTVMKSGCLGNEIVEEANGQG
jgi:hypothetical protein